MSWDVSIVDRRGEVVVLPVAHRLRGGTYEAGGSREAWLNVTYNYSPHYYEHLDEEKGLRWLDGKPVGETIDRLEAAAAALGTDRSAGYWDPTPGNAGAALGDLLALARLALACLPEGDEGPVWRVD